MVSVSIPSGPIKREICALRLCDVDFEFQFHLVQLKEGRNKARRDAQGHVSIPSGPIKSVSLINQRDSISLAFQFHLVQLKEHMNTYQQALGIGFNSIWSN